MKHLFVLILLIFVQNVLLQAQKNPDLSEEIAELKNDIKELESEIADARVNYPEDVPELQKELAASKKMLSAFEKMSGMPSGPQPAVGKAVPSAKAAYNSPIVQINLNQPVITPSPGEATDRLLWYTGKKINDSTLITTRAMVVQYQSAKNRVVAQPNTGSDPFKSLIEELEKSEQRKDELIDKMANLKNGVLYYPQLVKALEYYDDFTIRYNGVVRNTIDIPEIALNQNKDGGVPLNGQRSGLNFYDPMLEESEFLIAEIPVSKSSNKTFDDLPNLRDVKDVLKEALAKFKALPNPEDFPPPPEHELSICGSCDKKIVDKERKLDSLWWLNYNGKEIDIIQTVLGVYSQAALLGTEINETDPEIKSCLDVISGIGKRMDKKNDILIKKYGKDIKRSVQVANAVLGFERQKQLLGIVGVDNQIELSGLISDSDSSYLAYFKEQLGLKNYNFVLNIAKHMGRERQKQLLGTKENNDEIDYYWDNIVLKAFDINRFSLSLELDFVFEKVDDEDKLELSATGSIATGKKVYVSLYPDSCSWRMMLSEADYNNSTQQLTGIPLKVKSGEKKVQDENDNLATFSYSGHEDMVAFMPEFKINLCDVSERDSAFMMPINFPYGYIPQVTRDLNKSYKDEMLPIANHIFLDLKKMDDNVSEGMDLAADIVATLSESNVTDPKGNAKLDKMQMEYNIKLKQDSYKKDMSQLGMNKKSVFLFNANNGSTVFIDQTNDTKHQIDDYTKLAKGQIHLRVVHDPLE